VLSCGVLVDRGDQFSRAIRQRADRAIVAGDGDELAALLRDHLDICGDIAAEGLDARAIISQAHHFDTWDAFDSFRHEATRSDSTTAAFEASVEAVISGDVAELEHRLTDRPALIDGRSTRRHRATLLIYVGAKLGLVATSVHSERAGVQRALIDLLLAHGATFDNAVAPDYTPA